MRSIEAIHLTREIYIFKNNTKGKSCQVTKQVSANLVFLWHY